MNIPLRHAIYRANDAHRDAWISSKAKEVSAGSRVLDVGAGTGRHRSLFEHCRYESQDFCQYIPATEDSESSWAYGRIDFVCDATAVPVADQTYDAVLCTEVLEHVPQPALVVREIARLLKPGGTCILTAPLGSGLHMMPYHFFGGFTPAWYEKALSESGFTNIEIESNGGFFRLFGQEARRFSSLWNPLRIETSFVSRMALIILWPPLWLVTSVLLPVLCYFLDRFDDKKEFTIGYFVTARRALKPIGVSSIL